MPRNFFKIKLWSDGGVKRSSEGEILRAIGVLIEDENENTTQYSLLINKKKNHQELEAMALTEGLEIVCIYFNEDCKNIEVEINTDYKSLADIMDPENNGADPNKLGKDKVVLGLVPYLRKLESNFRKVNYKFVNSGENKADKICSEAFNRCY